MQFSMLDFGLDHYGSQPFNCAALWFTNVGDSEHMCYTERVYTGYGIAWAVSFPDSFCSAHTGNGVNPQVNLYRARGNTLTI